MLVLKLKEVPMTLQVQLGQRQHGGLVPVVQLPAPCLLHPKL